MIGTAGSWNSRGNTAAKAVDGLPDDFFDAPDASGDWVGYDLGSQFVISSVSFAPRIGFKDRLTGGVFQGANISDFSDAVPLYTIKTAPDEYGSTSISNSTPFRYVRYLSGPNGYCNISELSFAGTPVAAPANLLAATTGINAGGISDKLLELTAHPQYGDFCKAAGISRIRVWNEGAWTTHQPATYYQVLQGWAKAGISPIIVANFQNSTPKCAAPSDADWSGWCSAIPPPSVTGAVAIEIGNEVDTKTYYTGTVAQLAHLMQVAYPILHGKGYSVIAPSTLNGLDWVNQLQALNAYQFCDYLNIHSYKPTAAAVAADVDAAEVAAGKAGKPLAMTEWGTRPPKTTPQLWSAEQVKALGLIRQRSVMALSFPLYLFANDTLDQAAPFDASAAINQPYYNAMIGTPAK